MENKEFTYQGKTLNGILMLVLNIIGFLAGVGLFIFACVSQEGWLANVCGVCGVLLLILSIICVAVSSWWSLVRLACCFSSVNIVALLLSRVTIG